MDDEDRIRKFVRLRIYKCCDLEDILYDLCWELCKKDVYPGPDAIAIWYKNLRNGVDGRFLSSSYYKPMLQASQIFEGPPSLEYSDCVIDRRGYTDRIPPQELHLALEILATEFGNANRAYEARRCAIDHELLNCKMIMLSERYAIDTGKDSDGVPVFYFIDTWHNEQRKLQINGDLSATEDVVPRIVAVDPTHFICHTSSYDESGTNYVDVYLLRLNMIQMQCTIVAEHQFIDTYLTVLVDATDPRKFLFCFNDDTPRKYAQKARLSIDGNFEFDDEDLDLNIHIPGKNVDPYYSSRRFSDGKLYGLCRNLDKKEIIAFEIAFEQGKAHFLQLVNFEVDFETNVETTFVEGIDEGLEDGDFAWQCNSCYMIHCNSENGHSIYTFDMETQKMTQFMRPYYSKLSCISHFNGIILIGTLSHEFQHAWHRIPLSQPDSLLKSSMDRLQQEAIFMDNAEYAKFLQKLPPNLHPFGQSSVLESSERVD